MALNTQPSPNGDRPMPTKSLSTETQHHEVPIVDRLTGRVPKHSTSASRSVILHLPLLPPMNSRHMVIQVANPGEGMICHRTPSNPTKIRTLSVRIISTIWLVLTPCLFDLETFVTEWTNESTFRNHRICPMLGLVVVTHGLSTSKRLFTYRACYSLTLHARLGMVPPVTLACQHLPTLTTWELFSSVHPHMYSDPLVQLKRLPAHRTGGFSPWNTGNLVGYLSHLPALCPFRQILSPKESRHLLLHPPQCSFFDDDFILS